MNTIELKSAGGVGCLTFNRPDKRNAIDDEMRVRIAEALAGFEADPAIRVVLLTGAGTAFCAGVDLSTPGNRAQGPEPGIAQDRPRARLTEPLDVFSKPVIAAVNGIAVGGGLEIVLASDMRIAAASARFGLPEVKLGSLPGSGGTQRLPRVIGQALAAQMLFSGQLIDAEQARAAGLVSEVLSDKSLMDRAWELANLVASNAPLSLQAIKRSYRASIGAGLEAGLTLERALYHELANTEDRKEGRKAFVEKRKPNFQGR